MKVLHVNAGNLYGGIETLLVTLARERHACPEMQPEFALCFEGRLSEELRATGVTVHTLGVVRLRYPLSVLRARRRLGQALLGTDALVTHGSWSHAVFAPVAGKSRVPLVRWLHAPFSPFGWLDRWSARTPADLFIANSRFVQGTLRQVVPGARSQVVLCPLAPGKPARPRDEVRAALRTPPGVAVIAMVARLEPLKGHRPFLQALGTLAHLPWVAWIAGGVQRPREARYLRVLEAVASSSGIGDRVRFLGQRCDVPDLLAAADIYCQPNEGPDSFGLTFVEALAAGLPIITSACGGALEIVDDTCGVLIPPGSPSDLVRALGRLLKRPEERARLGSNGPARARFLCEPAARIRELHLTLLSA